MLILLSGPSGAGKSTFVRELLAADARLDFSISTTTRPKREGETPGLQYQFVNDTEFDRLVAAGTFVEWAQVHGHRYGTRRDNLAEIQARGALPLLDLDVQGGLQIIELLGQEVVSVFLFPPSWEVLEQRLRKRGTEDEAALQRRLQNARWEVGYADRYEYYLVNDDLETAVAHMRAILTAEQCRRIRWRHPPLGTNEG